MSTRLSGLSGLWLVVSDLTPREASLGQCSSKHLVSESGQCDHGNRLLTEDRLIMKQVQMVEINSFVEMIAPKYFKHVTDAIESTVRASSLLLYYFTLTSTAPSCASKDTGSIQYWVQEQQDRSL